jgi:uncharacterized membrane protein
MVGALILFVCVLIVLNAGLLIATIIALQRTTASAALQRRVELLERDLDELRSLRLPPTAEQQPPPSRAAAAEEEEILDAIPISEARPSQPPPHREALTSHRLPARREPRPPRTPDEAGRIEGVIGRQVLGWTAVVLLLFATGFFIKYAFENQWIGPLGRISSGALTGAALCVGGLVLYRRRMNLASQMLTAAGIGLLYLATFGSFGFYQLLPRDRAAVFLVILVLQSALLAVLYGARSIAYLTLAGGLLSPILLHSDHDQYRSLFLYLAVLDTGLLAVSLARGWLSLAPLALAGSQALYWIWFFTNYHPEKREAALIFQGALFVLFLVHDVIVPVLTRRSAHPIQLINAVANAFVFALAGYILLDTERTAFLAALAIGLAILHTALTAWAQTRSPDDSWLRLVLVAIGLAFLATAIGLRAHAGWVALGWAIEGLALWWFALRVRARPVQVLGAALLVMGLVRYLAADAPYQAHPDTLTVLNPAAVPGLAIAACLVAAGWLVQYLETRPPAYDRVARWLGGLTGVLLAWLVLSLEVYHFADRRWPDEFGTAEGLHRAQASLSIFWAFFAGAVLAAGFWRKLLPLRLLALGLFGLTLAKVILIDLAGLPGIYRIAAFFFLAIVMGGAAWGYQRFEAARRLLQVKEANDDRA